MGIALPVVFALLGMAVIGKALVVAAPPQWLTGEFILLLAFCALVRECWRFITLPRMAVRAGDPLAGPGAMSAAMSAAMPAGAAAGAGGTQRRLCAADVFGRASANAETAERAARQRVTDEIRPGQTVEQIAQEMIARSFRELSMQYHPDRGGDVEVMMRLNAARDLMLRSIRKR